jgi:signal transduction histidine kinase
MPAETHRRLGLGALIYVSGFVVVVAVLVGILAIDRHGDRQKQGQLLVSRIDSRLSLVQSVPWDADPRGADLPAGHVQGVLRGASREMTQDLLELSQIEPSLRQLLALQEKNADILSRQVAVVRARDDAEANKISSQAMPVFEEIRRRLDVAGGRFSRSAAAASRYTLLGTAGLMFALYGSFALTFGMLRRAQRQRSAQAERLRQSQKLEAIGQLAGGIAHDFNNLLTAISGNSQLALSRLDESSDSELREDIEEIVRSGDRAAALTRQLLAFGRRQTVQTTVFDLSDTVAGVERLLRRLIGSHIIIATDLAATDCSIQADHGQIEQVVMNLALNGRDAMPDGGILSVETEAVHLSQAEAGRRFGAPAGDYVLLRIRDNGEGMDEHTREHAFEPFYTTKAVGNGTGLGLATVHGIVSQAGGYVTLNTELSRGTTFEILLPRVDGAAADVSSEELGADLLRAGR